MFRLRFKGEGYTWQEDIVLGIFSTHEKAAGFQRSLVDGVEESLPSYSDMEKSIREVYLMKGYSFDTHHDKYIAPILENMGKLLASRKEFAEEYCYIIEEVVVDNPFSKDLFFSIMSSRYS